MHAQFLPCSDKPPAPLLPWLCHPGSLTAKLREYSGDARLQVIKQDWRAPNWWDKSVLGLQSHRILQRDILMSSKKKACWFARSLMPEPTVQSNPDVFERLQQEALGDIVFSHEHIQRTSLTHYAALPQCIEYHWPDASLINQAPIIWLRLSTFSIRRHYPFFLTELFIPSWVETLR